MQQYTLEDFSSTHQCPSCDRSFDTRSGLGRHHSLTHGEKLPKRTVPCSQCGVELGRDKHQIENQDKWFCSDDCHGDWRTENLSGKDNPHWEERESISCTRCGDSFEVPPSGTDRKFCSRECFHEQFGEEHSGENNPLYKEMVQKECEYCGGGFEVYPSRGSIARFCSYECHNKHKTTIYGPDHPLWTNGQDAYRSIRNALGPNGWTSMAQDARDDYDGECVMCGDDAIKNGRALSVHHIVPIMVGGDNGGYNLIPLCQSCHHKAERYTQSIPEIEPVLTE